MTILHLQQSYVIPTRSDASSHTAQCTRAKHHVPFASTTELEPAPFASGSPYFFICRLVSEYRGLDLIEPLWLSSGRTGRLKRSNDVPRVSNCSFGIGRSDKTLQIMISVSWKHGHSVRSAYPSIRCGPDPSSFRKEKSVRYMWLLCLGAHTQCILTRSSRPEYRLMDGAVFPDSFCCHDLPDSISDLTFST